MPESKADRSKVLKITTNLIGWGGIAAIVAFSIVSESKLLTVGVGIMIVLGLLILAGLFFGKIEESGVASPERDQDDAEGAVFANWSARAKQRRRDGTKMIGGAVPSFSNPVSSMLPKIREELSGFPTFSPDVITYDDSISEDDLVDDTLVDDTTGHGVDLEDGLFTEGLWVAFELLDMDQSEWSMTPWGYEMLFAIEALLAAGGHPSHSRQLGRLRTWSRNVSYDIDTKLALDLIGRIDFYMTAVREDPSGRQVNPDAMDQVEAMAERMRNRVALLL